MGYILLFLLLYSTSKENRVVHERGFVKIHPHLEYL